jgi:hypothetical protein
MMQKDADQEKGDYAKGSKHKAPLIASFTHHSSLNPSLTTPASQQE